MLVPHTLEPLHAMKHYPKILHYEGDLSLLERPMVSIVGSRRPSAYTRSVIFELSHALAMRGVISVSGVAGGVDQVAHEGSGVGNTIAVLPCGIDLRYPASNRSLIDAIAQKGLLLSPFEEGFKARAWSFVVRNELVVALGEILIVGEADEGSGSMRSVEYALAQEKKIYVLPHRLRESNATRALVAQGKAHAIDDLESFVDSMARSAIQAREDTPFLALCRGVPTYEEVVRRFPRELFESELGGIVEVRQGRVYVIG